MKKTILFLSIFFIPLTTLVAQDNQGSPVYGTYPTHRAADANTPADYFLIDNPLGKIYFSNLPFTTGSTDDKKTFRSNEFIYGRLKLNSGTVKDALKVAPKTQTEPQYYFQYEITIYKNKKKLYQQSVYVSKYCILKEEDLNKSYLDFDVLPNPSVAVTALAQYTDFDPLRSVSSSPLNNALRPEIFAEEGTYKIDVVLRNKGGKDTWGKDLPETSWPIFEADFNFELKLADVSSLLENEKKAREKLNGQFKNNELNARPVPKEWYQKSSPVAGGITEAAIKAAYTADFPGVKIAKFYAAPAAGWIIEKNDFGIPRLQYSSQLILLFCKDAERCWQSEVVLKKDYLGGGKYGAVYLSYNKPQDQDLILCEKMK